MPAPSIGLLASQRVIVSTPFRATTPIGNNPVTVIMRGELDTINYSFRNGILEVEGIFTRLNSNTVLKVGARNSDGAVGVLDPKFPENDDGSFDWIFEVVEAAPIIAPIGLLKIGKGVETRIEIPVTNPIGQSNIRGPLIGLGKGSYDGGLLVSGEVPDDADFTFDMDADMFRALIGNSGGMDIKDISFSLHDAPGAVRNLRASSDLLGNVTIRWDPPTDLGTPPVFYEFRQGESVNWAPVSGTGESLSGSGYEVGTYVFQVRAVDDNGIAGPAMSVTHTVSRAGVPSQITALGAFDLTSREVTAAWRPPDSDGGSPIIRYRYETRFVRISDGSVLSTSRDGQTTQLSVVVSLVLVEVGERMEFRVAAENAVGVGPYSRWITLYSNDGPPPVTVVRPVIAPIGNISRTTGYSAFTIQARLSSGTTGTWSISGTGASISSSGVITISAGRGVGTYNYTVTHTNSAGSDTESFSLTVSAAVVSPVIAPIGNISRTTGYSAFTIQARLSSGTSGTWSISGTGATISSSGLITIAAGRGVGTTNYTVTHTNAAGSDTESFSLTVTAAATVPGPPLNLTVDYTLTRTGPLYLVRTDITWLPPSSDGGSPITGYEYDLLTFGYPFTEWDSVASGTSIITEHILLVNNIGSSFRVRVRAVNSVGPGSASVVSSSYNV